MTFAHPKTPKFFTAESANACLPLVRAITADIVNLSRYLLDRRQRCDSLTRGRNTSAGDPYAQELAQVQQELAREEGKLREYERELSDLGVVLQSAPEGLVDFPALFDGRLVFLCWKYNEPEVLFWHERDAGFAGRQSLTADTAAGDAGPAEDDAFRGTS
jgi:hypothetical protein